MAKRLNNPDYIFETSWEVCNKVGGIYTVLSTKAKTMQEKYKDRTIFIGPDIVQIRIRQETFRYGKVMQRIEHIGFSHAVISNKTVDLG